jgi:TPR repeat protein
MFSLFSIPSDYFGMLNKNSMKNFRENLQNNNFFESTTTEQVMDIKMTRFEKAKTLAEQGDVDAQRDFGSMYYLGIGVEKNEAEALLWWKKAAEQGDVYAQRWADKLTKVVGGKNEYKSNEKNDPISPNHYKQGDIECIDAIRAMTSAMHGDGFKISCLKDVVKYVWRHEFKGGLEDLKKARWYLDEAIEQMEKEKD